MLRHTGTTASGLLRVRRPCLAHPRRVHSPCGGNQPPPGSPSMKPGFHAAEDHHQCAYSESGAVIGCVGWTCYDRVARQAVTWCREHMISKAAATYIFDPLRHSPDPEGALHDFHFRAPEPLPARSLSMLVKEPRQIYERDLFRQGTCGAGRFATKGWWPWGASVAHAGRPAHLGLQESAYLGSRARSRPPETDPCGLARTQ